MSGFPVATGANQALAVPTMPPLYANSFEIKVADYDVTFRFIQRDPYLDELTAESDRLRAEGGPVSDQLPSAADLGTQLPSSLVAMSWDAAKALHDQLGEALTGSAKTKAKAE